ncbi:MAG: hypothetical protein J6Y69_00010 [Treponema sp.]|nr:hypothetical protein [Treponema sp.]
MRKFVFVIIQFLLTGLQAFAIEWPEIKTYASINASTAPDWESTSFKKDAGLEIEWMNFSAIGAVGFSDSSSENEPLFRYGAELSFLIPGIELDCNIKAGTLKFSGVLGKLSSPGISAGTAFHSGPDATDGISVNLPSYNSSVSPLAMALNFDLTMGPGEIQVQGMASMEKEWASSLCYEFSTSWAKSFSVSLTAGSFYHSREAGTSWFSQRALYPLDDYLAAMAEIAFKAGAFSTSTSAAIYENPFGGVRLWFKTLDSLEFKKWSLHTGLFLCDSELIASDGSRPCIRTQFFVNPELCLGPIKNRFRAGLLFYDSMKISSTPLRIPYSIYTVRGDLSYSNPGITLKLSGYWTLDQLNEETKIWSSLNLSYKMGIFGAGTTISAQFEGEEGTFSLAQKLTLANPFRLSARGKITMIEKEVTIKNLKAEATLSTSFSLKNVSVNLNAGINSVLLKN